MYGFRGCFSPPLPMSESSANYSQPCGGKSSLRDLGFRVSGV